MKTLDLKKNPERETPQAVLLEWKSGKKEFLSRSWQIGIAIFLVLCFLFFLWQKNYFGIILILIIAFFVFFSPKQEKDNYYAITERGARIKDEVFPWKNLESFWIFKEPPELYLKSKKSYFPYIILSLEEQDFNTIKNILLNYLPEEEAEKNLFDVISRKMGL